MKIAFFSSVLNHHQLPLCNELFTKLGDDFIFVATMEMEAHRIKLGYEDISENYSFCLKMHTSNENYQLAYLFSQECDILIAGVIPYKFLNDRLKNNKITFRYSERLFNNGFWRILSPRAIYLAYQNHLKYRNKKLYLLCASAYLPFDVTRIFSYPKKMFKWGYFPSFEKHNTQELILKKAKNVVSILWVGRFIDWKQPEIAIKVAKYLSNRGIEYSLEMIGIGPLKTKCEHLVTQLGISKNVTFAGPMSPDLVRKKMVDSNIFLLTSNAGEGWGVVLNEAMNSGCAVLANKDVGSVPYLIISGINGISYDDDNIEKLYKHVENLILDENLRKLISLNAYKTIEEFWNPKEASSRLINLFSSLLNDGEIFFYKNGPLSKAEIIK